MDGGRDDCDAAEDERLKASVTGDAKLSEKTRAKYLALLQAAVRDTSARSLSAFLANPKKHLSELARKRHGMTDGAMRDVATAVCAMFRRNTEFACDHKEAHARWKSLMIALAKEVRTAKKNNIATDKEIEGMVPLGVLAAAEARLGHATARESQDKIVLAFAAYVPAKRADLGACELVGREEDIDDGDKNYIVVPETGTGGVLILNRYKTAKHYGRHREGLPDRVTRVIRDSVKAWPRNWLLSVRIGTDKGKPLTNEAYGQRYTAVIKRYTGRKSNLNMNRHVHANSVADGTRVTVQEAEDTAKKMMHSVVQQRHYARVVAA